MTHEAQGWGIGLNRSNGSQAETISIYRERRASPSTNRSCTPGIMLPFPPAATTTMHHPVRSRAGPTLAKESALLESEKPVQDAACDDILQTEKLIVGKRKRKRKEEKEKGMGEKKKKEDEKEKNGMVVTGKAKKKEKLKGRGGGILSNKLFSELEISEFTAKAIREMNYTHLTEVLSLSLKNLSLHHLFSIYELVFSVPTHRILLIVSLKDCVM